MGDRGQREAWVTLATNDAYALGCLVLGNSLRRVATTRQLVVMVTDGVSQGMRNQLGTVFDRLVDVSLLDSQDARNLALLGRPDLNVTFTKIHCWKLTDYQKCVFLDADTLVIRHCDELFDREEFSAAPDAGWPDCFNSGVFVFCPSLETYNAILNFAMSRGSFDGGDQGLLNSYFNTWATEDIMKHLPFIYNVVSQAFYSYLPAFEQFKNNIKIVHFIGPIKPWNHPYNTATRTVTVFPETGHCQQFLQMWWDLFMETVQPRLDPAVGCEGGLVGELAQMKLGDTGQGADYMVLDDRERRLAWERGHADYLGIDSFDNIMKKMEEKMAPTPSPSNSGNLRKSGGGEGSASGTSLPAKPTEVNGSVGGGVYPSQPAPIEASVTSVASFPSPVVPHLPSPPVAEAEGGRPQARVVSAVPVAGEVTEPPPVEVASLVQPPVAVAATVPVVSPEPQPVVSASISLGGGGGEPEAVTETVSLGGPSPATFTAPPRPSATAPPPKQSEEVSSVTLSLTPQSPPPAPVPKAVAAPVPEPKAVPPPVPEPKAVAAPVPEPKVFPPPVLEKKGPGIVGKPQEKLPPLQIGKKPPPPTPEKPASPAGVSPRSPPPPVAQKPTSPVEEGKTSPLVPAKPTSPGAATGISAQRSMFEKPAPGSAKPGAARVGGSISAFAARFQQPPPSQATPQTPVSKPAPAVGLKPSTPTSPTGVGPKPSTPTSPTGVGPKPSTPTSPGGVAPKPTSPFGVAAKPTPPSSAGVGPKPGSAGPSGSAASPTSPSSGGSKNADFLARYGLKKK